MNQSFPVPTGSIPVPLARPSNFGKPDAVWDASSPSLPSGLPPLPDGFKLDSEPATDIAAGAADLPPLPDGFKLDAPSQSKERGFVDSAANIAKGVGERSADLAGGLVRTSAVTGEAASDFLARGAKAAEERRIAEGKEYPSWMRQPSEQGQKVLNRSEEEIAAASPALNAANDFAKKLEDTDFGYEPGTTWEDFKASPARNFAAFVIEQGLVSAPDMAAAIAAMPAYVAARTGEIGQQRAQNNGGVNATADDLMKALPAATVSAALERFGAKGMFGLDEAAVQSLKQVPKEMLKAGAKEGVTEAGQEGVEYLGSNLGTQKGVSLPEMGEQMAAGMVAGSGFGAGVRAGTASAEVAAGRSRNAGQEVEPSPAAEMRAPADMPALPAGFTLDTSPIADVPNPAGPTPAIVDNGVDGNTVEDQPPIDVADSSQPSSGPPPITQITPEHRATLRASALPDEDIDLMSPEEVSAKVAEAAQAGIQPSAQEIDAAGRYRAQGDVLSVDAPSLAESAPEATSQQNEPAPEARPSATNDEVEPVYDLEALQRDIAGDVGMRSQPASVAAAENTEGAASRVNLDPSDAQKAAGNYQKGHARISGLDVTIETPKGAVRSGVGVDGRPWASEMPAHYGYVKRSTGADGDQVDVYIGDNPSSRRVYVVDQKNLKTQRFDEHKAILGASSMEEARNLYSSAFSDGSGPARIGAVTPMSVSEFRSWLKDGDTKKPVRMGRLGIRTDAEGYPINVRGEVKKPESITEFIARKGGIKEQTGELGSIGLRERAAGFVPRVGNIIRPNGMNPDMAREASAEAGYLAEGSSLSDLYDALDADARSGRSVFSRYDDDWAYRWRGQRPDAERYGPEEDQAQSDARDADDAELKARDDIYHQMMDDGYTGEFGDDFSQRVAGHMLSGVKYDTAVELADAEMIRAEGFTQYVEPHLPFFGDENNEAFAGTAPASVQSLDEGRQGRDRPRTEDATQARLEAEPVRGARREEGERAGSGVDSERSTRQGPEVGDNEDRLSQDTKPVDKDYSANPDGWGEVDGGASTNLTAEDQQKIHDIVRTVSGLSEVEWKDRIGLPNGAPGWGSDAPTTAAGYYDPSRDVIAIAMDSGSRKAAYHEAFHRLQRLFLTEREQNLLASQENQLRQIVAEADGREGQAARMSRKEIEAEAFAIWAEKARDDGADGLRLRAPLRAAWGKILRAATRVKNFLAGKGFETFEDIFAKAKKGRIQERGEPSKFDGDREYSIAERGAVEEARKYPEAALGKRLSETLSDAGRKSVRGLKGLNKRDRLTKNDGETTSDYIHRKLVDYLHPLRMMQESVGAKLNDLNDAYQTARLAEGTIRHEIQQIDEKYTAPMVDALVRGGASLEELHRYLYALHAEERNRVVGSRHEKGTQLNRAVADHDVKGASGWSTNEARQALREFAKDKPKLTTLQEAGGHVRAMLDQSLKDQRAAGLISGDTYDMLTNQWKHYVPLKSADGMDEDGNYLPPSGSGFDVRGDEFKSALGLFSDAENVIVHAVGQAERSVMRQEKNKVGTAVLRFVNQFDPKGENFAQVYWAEDPQDKTVMPDITKMPDVYKRALGADGKVTNRKVSNPLRSRDDAIAVKLGGKTYFVRFKDPKVGLALRKLSLEEITMAAKVARQFSNIQSLINTRMNPAFVPVNFIRDVQTGSAFLLDEGFSVRDVAKVSADIPKAWGAIWRQARGRSNDGRWDKLLNDFISAGGKISFDQFNTVEQTLAKIKSDMVERSGGRSAPLRVWKSFIKVVEDLNDTVENGFRLAAFAAARDKGRSLKNAAFMARDLTVDFQKKGDWGGELSSWYVFANASIQGNYNLAKRLAKSRSVKAVAAGMILGGFAQHMWNSMMAGDDDDGENVYKKMLRNEPYKLERQMVLFLPGSKQYVSFPLAYGLNVFWNLGTQGGAVTSGDVKFLPALIDSTRVAFDAFNPIGSGSAASMISPTISDPFMDLLTNENFFGAPIYPKSSPFDPAPTPDSHKAFKSTHPFFKWSAEALNSLTGGDDVQPGYIDVHPDSMEHLWGFFTGGIGRFLSQTAETGQRAFNGEFEPKKTPWLRSFYGAIGEDSQRGEYYDQRERVQEAKAILKDYQEKNDREAVDKFRKEREQDIRAIPAFEAAEKQRKKLNKERRSVESGSGNTQRLERLNEIDSQIMTRARKAYFEARDAK